jgi:rhodanese-related sulfurtransferase
MREMPPIRTLTLFLAFVAGLSLQPVLARDWLDASVMSAASRVLAEMPDDYFQILPDAAGKEIARASPVVLVVREPGEYKTERIAAAQNIPIRELTKSVDKLPASKTTPILVYCRSGHRGAVALTVLRMAGYTNVRSIRGGLESWKAAGMPVTR